MSKPNYPTLITIRGSQDPIDRHFVHFEERENMLPPWGPIREDGTMRKEWAVLFAAAPRLLKALARCAYAIDSAGRFAARGFVQQDSKGHPVDYLYQAQHEADDLLAELDYTDFSDVFKLADMENAPTYDTVRVELSAGDLGNLISAIDDAVDDRDEAEDYARKHGDDEDADGHALASSQYADLRERLQDIRERHETWRKQREEG